MELFYETLETPLGPITVEADSDYVLKILFDWEGTETRPNAITKSCKRQLEEYFAGNRTEPSRLYRMLFASVDGLGALSR